MDRRSRPHDPSRAIHAALVAIALGCRSAAPATAVAPLPELRADTEGCRVPAPTEPLELTSGSAPGRLDVRVRSTRWPDWAGTAYVRLVGPLPRPSLDRQGSAEGRPVAVTGLRPGRYVVRIGAIGHYPRVDTLAIGPMGLTVVAPLDPTPSHWCGVPGDGTHRAGARRALGGSRGQAR